jgi:D-serine dehydratase
MGCDDLSVLNQMISYSPQLWLAAHVVTTAPEDFNLVDIEEAADRLTRFAPLIEKLFPETADTGGIIESPLKPLSDKMGRELLRPQTQDKESLARRVGVDARRHTESQQRFLLKCDNDLPIAGSIKARGGIYEVLKYAEELALEAGRIGRPDGEDDYLRLAGPAARSFFSRHTIAVGSTGNLGLSVGIMGAALGFRVTVHMSAEAKSWKKELLRSRGAEVVEHSGDYSSAVEAGRKACEDDPRCHFVDDENSRDLFLGYAVAGLRLKDQLASMDITVGSDHPLFVYLPCGVGGGPGGITLGLKLQFGPHVHCFFAEPTHAPCMLLGLLTGKHDQVSIYDYGLDGRTIADGLAVGRPSRLVGKAVGWLISGVFTVDDDELLHWVQAAAEYENTFLEPSAAAGFPGPGWILGSGEGRRYLQQHGLADLLSGGGGGRGATTHIIWSTGGGMMPEEERIRYVGQIGGHQ